MSRLVAFGCSLTYGHGLPDCHVDPCSPGPTASKFVWPETVAQRLNRTCVNMATCGSSNKRIWHSVANFKFKPDDVVIILWSFQDRSAILKNKKTVEDLGSWIETASSESYYRDLYNSYDSLMQTKLYVSHVNFLLKEKQIPIYNLTTMKDTVSIFKLSGQVIPHIPLYICDDYRNKYPKGLDNKHPGLECHNIFATDVLTYIDNRIYKPKTFFERIRCMLI